MEDTTTLGESDENTLQSRRDKLLTLVEKHEIKYTGMYIKKASQSMLEKIKQDYERKQLEETNEYLSDTLINNFSEFMRDSR